MPSIEFDTPTTAEFFTNEPSPAEVVGADPYGDASDATYVKGWSVQDTVTPANAGFHHIYADFAPATVDGSAITAALRVSVELSGAATDAWFIANFYEAGAVIGTDDPILNLTLGATAAYVDTGASGTPEVLNPTFNDWLTDTPATAEQIETYFAGGGFLMIQPFAVGTGNPPSTATVTLHKIDIAWGPTNMAACGEKVIKYEVTTQLAQPYVVSPRGPDDDTHHNAFKIAPSRTVSMMISLASEIGQDIYVQPQVRFLTWTGLDFTVTTTQNLGSAVHLVGDGAWETITRFDDADPNSTHFYIDFAVASTADGDAPDIGTILYLDCAFIPDNGLDLSTEQYLDGTVIGNMLGDGCWEGPAHNSTSIYCAVVEEEDEPPPPEGGDEEGGDGEPPVEPDDSEPIPEGDPLPEEERVPTTSEIAASILAGVDPSGLCLGADIQLGEHLFNTIDEFGVLWLVSDIEGWWTLPEPDIPDFPKGIDDGSYEARGRYTARVFTITGSFIPSNRSEVRAARDRLIRAANLCHYGAWFGTHESDATRASKVWLSGQPSISTVNTNGRTDFSIGLKAPDPIKYGIPNGRLTDPGYEMTDPLISKNEAGLFGRKYPRKYDPPDSSGRWSYIGDIDAPADETTATNAGNVRVYPTITIDGPTLGPIRIYNETTGQMMRVQQGTTGVENQVVIDCFNRTVTYQDHPLADVLRNQRFRLDTVTDWIYLNPGTNRIYFTEETGGGLAKITVSWRSGWIG